VQWRTRYATSSALNASAGIGNEFQSTDLLFEPLYYVAYGSDGRVGLQSRGYLAFG
jgi:hypothetical protein